MQVQPAATRPLAAPTPATGAPQAAPSGKPQAADVFVREPLDPSRIMKEPALTPFLAAVANGKASGAELDMFRYACVSLSPLDVAMLTYKIAEHQPVPIIKALWVDTDQGRKLGRAILLHPLADPRFMTAAKTALSPTLFSKLTQVPTPAAAPPLQSDPLGNPPDYSHPVGDGGGGGGMDAGRAALIAASIIGLLLGIAGILVGTMGGGAITIGFIMGLWGFGGGAGGFIALAMTS